MTAEEADELYVRFIAFAPSDALSTPWDVALVLQDLIWYHEAMHRNSPSRSGSFQSEFVRVLGELFGHRPALRARFGAPHDIARTGQKLASGVRPYGCIILNERRDEAIVVSHTVAPDQYSFPKGKRSEGEAPEQTAVRETYEETGLDVRGLIDTSRKITYERSHGRAPATLFIVVLRGERPKLQTASPMEIARVRWVRIDQLRNERVGGGGQTDGPTRMIATQLADWIQKHPAG